MAKEPADRYATAQELADDLRRFLRRQADPGAPSRPWLNEPSRWSAGTAGGRAFGRLVLVLSSVCLSISTVLIWNAMARTERLAPGQSS